MRTDLRGLHSDRARIARALSVAMSLMRQWTQPWPVYADATERSLVRGLQRRVHARGSASLLSATVGIKEVAEKIWFVTFMHYDLGFFDHETGRVECTPNPFEAQVLPMSPE
jgi:hypothetical protein